MNLLMADDSKLLRESLKNRICEIKGITNVYETTSCIETLAVLEEFVPDVLILDIRLGDGTGFDVLRKWQRQGQLPVIIVFTGFPYLEYRKRASELGADYFVEKSQAEDLFDLLEQVVSSQQD